jgi:hypothetical protein
MATGDVADVTARVRRRLADPDGLKYLQPDLYDAINEAVREVVRQILGKNPMYWLRTSETQKHQVNLVANTANYDLPASLWAIIQVDVGGEEPLDSISLERSLDSDAEGWLLKKDDIFIYPTPDTDVTNGLTIYYIPRPTEVAATSTAVPLFNDFGDPIILYCCTLLKAIDEEKTGDFGQFYRVVSDSIDAMMTRMNRPASEGLRVLWRDMV